MSERLELTGPSVTSHAVSFMNLMRDPAFRRAFEEDPAATAMREFQLKVPARALGVSNRLLAAILGDPGFQQWAQGFQADVERRHPALTTATTVGQMAILARAATAEIRREFAEGVAAHLPPKLASSLDLEKLDQGRIADEDDIALILLVFIAVVVVIHKSREDILSRNSLRLLVNQLEALKAGPAGDDE